MNSKWRAVFETSCQVRVVTEVICSFQGSGYTRVWDLILMNSHNSLNVFDSKEMPRKFLSTRLDIEQHCVLPILKKITRHPDLNLSKKQFPCNLIERIEHFEGYYCQWSGLEGKLIIKLFII